MQRVLVLSSKSPYPIYDGAAIRTVQSIRFFHELGYEVDLLYVSENDDYDIVKAGLNYCRNIFCHVMTKQKSYMNVLKGLLTNRKPLQVNYFYSPKIRAWIKNHQEDYDIVYCNNIRTAEYAKGLKVNKILDYVDALSLNCELSKQKTKGLWHWIYTIDAYRCAQYERAQMGIFDKLMIISDVDRSYIARNVCDGTKKDIAVIENYTKIDTARRVDVSTSDFTIVFVGAMNYAPNVEAVTYFSKEIMPSLLDKYPHIKFYIVGKEPRDCVKELASDNIIVTGFVDSVWDYLKRATVVVTPMLSGSGLQNKILEALAVGACVVTTKIGFEGLQDAEGKPFVASSSEEMIDLISYLFDNPDDRLEYSGKAVAYVEANYSKDVILRKFAGFIER